MATAWLLLQRNPQITQITRINTDSVMSTNHIVFFTQLYYPDMTTTAIIMSDLAEDLASYGMKKEVICAQPTYLVKGGNSQE